MQIDSINNNSDKWATAAKTAVTSADNATVAADARDAVITDVKASDQSSTTKNTTEKQKEQKVKDASQPHMEIDNTVLKFKVHDQTGDIMIQIVDNNTGKVVREIPPEKILDSIAEIWKNSGINVDKKA